MRSTVEFHTNLKSVSETPISEVSYYLSYPSTTFGPRSRRAGVLCTSTDRSSIDRHAFERFLIADCAQSATCNVYALEHNSGVPGVLSTNPARSSTSRMSARQLTGWLTPRAPV